jgi:hypothetical protein
MTEPREFPCRRQASRARTHYSDLPVAGSRPDLWQLIAMRPRPVRDVSFQMADPDRQPFHATNTFCFALAFLGTDTTGDRRQRIVAKQALCGFGDFSLGKQINEGADVHADRTALYAFRIFALQAAIRFKQGELLGESEIHFAEIRCACSGILFRHLLAFDLQPLLRGDEFGHDAWF